MYSADKIRNADLKKAKFGGYNMDEVDDLLDEVADAYEKLEQAKADADARYAILTEKVEGYRSSENSIHTALLNAQKLADQTVKEASEAAGHAAADAAKRAETVISQAEEKAAQIIGDAQLKAKGIVADSIAKTESMIAAAHDSVARQQMLFDKLKVETCNMRDDLLARYKKQISFVESLPDEVPFNAERAAEVITFEFDSVPDYEAIASAAKPSLKNEVLAAKQNLDEDEFEEPVSVAVQSQVASVPQNGSAAPQAEDAVQGGFVVNTNVDI